MTDDMTAEKESEGQMDDPRHTHVTTSCQTRDGNDMRDEEDSAAGERVTESEDSRGCEETE